MRVVINIEPEEPVSDFAKGYVYALKEAVKVLGEEQSIEEARSLIALRILAPREKA